MWLLVLVLVVGAEPDRFAGGAKATPLDAPGPVDSEPSLHACSTVTLRSSSKCFFDGRPGAVAPAERAKQAKTNVDLAATVGKGLCVERSSGVLDPKEKQRRLALCSQGTARASGACSLEGAEVLLDAEGRFSTQARGCYEALATALQTAEVPLVAKDAP